MVHTYVGIRWVPYIRNNIHNLIIFPPSKKNDNGHNNFEETPDQGSGVPTRNDGNLCRGQGRNVDGEPDIA